MNRSLPQSLRRSCGEKRKNEQKEKDVLFQSPPLGDLGVNAGKVKIPGNSVVE
jgi:hypothetical protein